MGYNTSFKGTLYFKEPLTEKEYNVLSKYLGEDIRDHKNWLKEMRKINPNFNLKGSLLTQGEKVGDIQQLIMKNKKAVVLPIKLLENYIYCPKCGIEFTLEKI